MTTIVLCVDKDNDFGRKAGIEGPIIGKKNNLKAATALALFDPEDSDVNAVFAGIKIYDDISKKEKAEIITITGYNKQDYKSDKRLIEQIDFINKKFNPNGFIIVTDGAEDEQIIPLIQSRGKIISIKTVVVKQAKQVESIYYTLKEALKEPSIARTVFGIPGIILLVYGLTLILNVPHLFFQGISFVLGIYLLLKGFGIEASLISGLHHLSENVSVQKISFPFYIASIFILLFGLITAYNNIMFGSKALSNILNSIQGIYFFVAMAVLFVVLARVMDVIQAKKAIYLRKYFLYTVSIILLWFIVDTGTLVVLRQADLNFFLISVLISFIGLLLSFKISEAMDLRKKATSILELLPVYSSQGLWIGTVKKINKKAKEIIIEAKQKEIKVKEGKFTLKGNRVVLS